jgi:hypothetical protein
MALAILAAIKMTSITTMRPPVRTGGRYGMLL